MTQYTNRRNKRIGFLNGWNIGRWPLGIIGAVLICSVATIVQGNDTGFATSGKNTKSPTSRTADKSKREVGFGVIKPVADVVTKKGGSETRDGKEILSQYSQPSLIDVLDEIEKPRSRKTNTPGPLQTSSAKGQRKSPQNMTLLEDTEMTNRSALAAGKPIAETPTTPEVNDQPRKLMREDESSLRRRVAAPAPQSSPIQPLSIPESSGQMVNKVKETANDGRLLIQYQSPVIDIQATGPKRIIVGQESPYQIRVRNTSRVQAENLVITTEIPSWVEVTNLAPTTGNSNLSTNPNGEKNNSLICFWRLGTLASGKEETLTLNLIPRQRNNFELLSRYDFEQTTLKAGIEVQEPAIELAIEGRNEIEWGIEDKYRLRVRNSGNGDAENVRLTVSTGDGRQATHTLGLLKAGDEKTMELAVKTHLENKVEIGIKADGDYGVSAMTKRQIKVLRGNLDLFVEMPELQFVNNSVECLVHVANSGTAAIRNAQVKVAIPPEFKFQSCSEEGQYTAEQNSVIWNISNLNVGEKLVYQMICQMAAPGVGRINVAASDTTGIAANQEAAIQIEAIAALHIEVKAPNGPVAVGTPVTYEVCVVNKGTKAARNINAALFLTNAFKPVSVEYGSGTIQAESGKVIFNPISLLGAGQSATYKVQAVAEASGNHKIQAILHSDEDGIQLAGEAITYCYQKRTVARRTTDPSVKVAMNPVESTPDQKAAVNSPAPLPNQPAPIPTPAPVPAQKSAIPVNLNPSPVKVPNGLPTTSMPQSNFPKVQLPQLKTTPAPVQLPVQIPVPTPAPVPTAAPVSQAAPTAAPIPTAQRSTDPLSISSDSLLNTDSALNLGRF